MKWTSFVVVGFLLGMLIGWNLGGRGETLSHLWNPETDGLIKMDRILKQDKTRRMAACVITENQTYWTLSVNANLVCELKPKNEQV